MKLRIINLLEKTLSALDALTVFSWQTTGTGMPVESADTHNGKVKNNLLVKR